MSELHFNVVSENIDDWREVYMRAWFRDCYNAYVDLFNEQIKSINAKWDERHPGKNPNDNSDLQADYDRFVVEQCQPLARKAVESLAIEGDDFEGAVDENTQFYLRLKSDHNAVVKIKAC